MRGRNRWNPSWTTSKPVAIPFTSTIKEKAGQRKYIRGCWSARIQQFNIFNHIHSHQGDEKSDVDGDEAREEYLVEAEDAAEEEEVE